MKIQKSDIKVFSQGQLLNTDLVAKMIDVFWHLSDYEKKVFIEFININPTEQVWKQNQEL